MNRLAATLLAVLCFPLAAGAQPIDGYVSVLVDVFPNLKQDADRRPVTELRTRLVAEYRRDLGSRFHLTASAFVEGLAANRIDDGLTKTAIVRPQELNIEARWSKADVRLGFSRIAWGRLDEFLPTDVVNPLDLTRFFLEGRSEGRMPVGMVRGRWMPSDRFSLEGVYVPFFRAGRYDQLDEDTAPFNIAPRVPFQRHEPGRALSNGQGGVRATATSGRVDWSASAYRGFEPFPLLAIAAGDQTLPFTFEERFPRFTMIGGDFETVRGEWGLRGEAAAFVERSLQTATGIVKGRAFEGGVGVDRKAGSYRLSGNAIVAWRAPEGPAFSPALANQTDTTLVLSVDRSFARETRSIRAFAVYNPDEQSTFARVIGSFSLRDNVALEASAGLFAGDGADVLARFADRDFLYLRLKVFY